MCTPIDVRDKYIEQRLVAAKRTRKHLTSYLIHHQAKIPSSQILLSVYRRQTYQKCHINIHRRGNYRVQLLLHAYDILYGFQHPTGEKFLKRKLPNCQQNH